MEHNFEYYFFIVIICICTLGWCVSDWYSSTHKYIWITIISYGFKFNLTTGAVCFMGIIHFNPIFCPKFSWLIWLYYLTNVLFFDIQMLYYYINLRSSITLCLLSGDIYMYIFLRYFFFICNCFGIILLQSFWDFHNFFCDFNILVVYLVEMSVLSFFYILNFN